MNPYRLKVSLRVTHPAQDAKSICDEFGMAPQRSWTVGERRTAPKGNVLEGFYRQTYCTFDLYSGASTESDLEETLRETNRRIRQKAAFIDQLIRSGGHIEYFVGLFGDENLGVVFEPDLLHELSELGITLSLDIYPGPDERRAEPIV